MISDHLRPLLSLVSAALLWLFCATGVFAQTDNNANRERAAIEIITIEHRAPERIRQQLTAALDPRGSIGQIDDKLVIATTAGNLAQLKTLIARQDIPPRRLVISADFDYQSAVPDPLSQFSEPTLEGEQVQFHPLTQAAMVDGDDANGASATSAQQDSSAASNASAAASPHTASQPEQQLEASAQPALIVSAEVQDDMAVVTIEHREPDGRSLRYRMDVTLSEWYPLDPTAGPPLTAVRVDLLP